MNFGFKIQGHCIKYARILVNENPYARIFYAVRPLFCQKFPHRKIFLNFLFTKTFKICHKNDKIAYQRLACSKENVSVA